jgi:hypothetical protein
MMRAKRVQLYSASQGIFGMIGFRSELPDGTFWVFSGKAVPAIGIHGGGNDTTSNIVLELRWPDANGAHLAGDCGFSAFEIDAVVGISGLVLFDQNGTVGKLTGVTFGAGVQIVPAGWGHVRQAKSFDG